MELPLKPNIGVSACLLGHRVRYSGDGSKSPWLTGALREHVSYVPFCPEVQMGLGTPRSSVRLVRGDDGPRMVDQKGNDHTAAAHTAGAEIVARLSLANIDGLVLKKGSPTCGIERVKVYTPAGMPVDSTQGLFAARVTAAFPTTPVIDDGRLHDAFLRAHFSTRVFAHARLRAWIQAGQPLQEFHREHKLLLYSHSPVHYTALGRIAANPAGLAQSDLWAAYHNVFFLALSVAPSVGKRVNVLQHMAGFLKKQLSGGDKRQVGQVIEEYRQGLAPFAAPLALFKYLSESHAVSYLRSQVLFTPYPNALAAGGYP